MNRGRLLALVIATWLVHDALVPTRYAVDARLAMYAIDRYRAAVSPRLRGFVQCRFVPTCSLYGRESIRKHGFAFGGIVTLVRIAKCGPWTPFGTSDPP